MATTKSKKQTDKRQGLKGILIKPKQQLTFAALFIGGSLLTLTALIGLMVIAFNHTLQTLVDRNQLTAHVGFLLKDTMISPFAISILFGTFLGFGFAWWGIRLSHRIYGPLIPIQRHIEKLKAGEYSARMQLRKTDELTEIRDALNDLAETLERKYKS